MVGLLIILMTSCRFRVFILTLGSYPMLYWELSKVPVIALAMLMEGTSSKVYSPDSSSGILAYSNGP